MKRFAYILLIGISAIISCTNSPEVRYPRYSTFPKETAKQARVIELDTALFRYPFRVAVKDSMAIVMDLHNADYYFHAFSYPDWQHLVSFGKRGEGPEEMLSAETFRFDSPDSLYALDANKMQLSRWSVSAFNRLATRQEVIQLDKSLIRSLDFYATDSCFLIPDYSGEHRYWQIDHRGRPIKSIGKIPSEKDLGQENHPALAQAWRSFIDYNPHNGILVLVTQLGEVLEIYNTQENTHSVLYGPNGEPEFRNVKGEGIPTGIMGFSDVVVTDRRIYAVFQGVSFKEKFASLQRGENPEDGGRYLYVFDLKGNPIQQYTLDRPIYGIDVNEETKTLIATCVESDEPILEFKL